MVNSGKPSLGCDNCKKRRIKCDRTRPKCKKCVLSRRECPGVPDEGDILFKNETQTVTAKARGHEHNSKTAKSSRDGSERLSLAASQSRSSSPEQFLEKSGFKPLPRTSLTAIRLVNPSIESLAISFWFRNFIDIPLTASTLNPYLTLLIPIYCRSDISSPVRTATAACALGAWSRWPDMASFKGLACQAFGKAIKELKAALSNPKTCHSDETLLATMLLGLHELLDMVPSQSTFKTNEEHLKGAMAIISMRGEDMFSNAESFSLFRGIRTALVMNAVYKAKAINFKGNLDFWATKGDDPYPMDDLYRNAIEVPGLRERMDAIANTPINQDQEKILLDIMATAYAMESKLAQWHMHLPPEYSYSSISSSQVGPEAWPGIVHIYQERVIAGTLNNYRTLRLFVLGIVAQCLARLGQMRGGSRYAVQYREVLQMLRELVDDICASLPYQLGWTPMSIVNKPETREAKAEEALGAFLLFRPLGVAVGVECIPESQRDWIRTKLQFISTWYGNPMPEASGDNTSPVIAGQIYYGFVDSCESDTSDGSNEFSYEDLTSNVFECTM